MLRRFYHSTCVLNNLKKQGLKLSKMLNPKSKKWRIMLLINNKIVKDNYIEIFNKGYFFQAMVSK